MNDCSFMILLYNFNLSSRLHIFLAVEDLNVYSFGFENGPRLCYIGLF